MDVQPKIQRIYASKIYPIIYFKSRGSKLNISILGNLAAIYKKRVWRRVANVILNTKG
jgi:hypothetical protein